MSLSDYLLGTLGLYGPGVLFVVLLVGAIGLPSPGSLLLLVAALLGLSLWRQLRAPLPKELKPTNGY